MLAAFAGGHAPAMGSKKIRQCNGDVNVETRINALMDVIKKSVGSKNERATKTESILLGLPTCWNEK